MDGLDPRLALDTARPPTDLRLAPNRSTAPTLGAAIPPHKDHNRGHDLEYEGLDLKPCQGQPTMPATQGQRHPT